MSKRDTWKALNDTVPPADESNEKELGMTAASWRQAISRYRCALALSHEARSSAETHIAAADDAARRLAGSQGNGTKDPYITEQIKGVHKLQAKEYLAIAEAHKAVAERERADASCFANALITRLTPRLVQQRLAALDPETAATIKRLFGDDITDPRTRARVFEVCDFVYFEGGDEEHLARHMSIS